MRFLFLILISMLIGCVATRDGFVNPDVRNEALKTVELVNDKERVLFGPENAPITIVKYADFQCPACAYDVQSMDEVKKKYGKQVRFIHKHMPLERIHPQARLAAQIYEALVTENREIAQKFYYEAYGTQKNWRSEKDVWALVKRIGGQKKKILKKIKSGVIDKRIAQDVREHEALGFQGTPAYMINHVSLYGAQRFETLDAAIEASLRK